MNINSKIEKILSYKYHEDQLAHFYLIEPNTKDQEEFCLNWVNHLIFLFTQNKSLHNHEDVFYFTPDNGKETYHRDQLNQVQQFLNYNALKFKRKFIIISHGENLSEIQINKLLKTFEEPPVKATIFFINRTKKTLMATLTSRASILRPTLTTSLDHDDKATDDRLKIYFDQSFSDFHKSISTHSISVQILLSWLTKEVLKSECSFEHAKSLIRQNKNIEEDIRFNNSMQSILYKLYEVYNTVCKNRL